MLPNPPGELDLSQTRARRSLRKASAALGVVGALLLAACGHNSSTPNAAPIGRTLTLSFLQDPGQPPDPDVYYGTQGLLLTTNVYEGLLTYQADVAVPTIAPALATSWTQSADHMTFILQLRRGVTFHDGTPFDAAAVKKSFDRRLAVNQGPAYMVQEVASVTEDNPYQVTIKLKGPDSGFLDVLASPYGPKMLSPTGLAANTGSDNAQSYLMTHDLGTGPYELAIARVGSAYQLQSYDNYWGKRPYFSTVNIPVITDSSAEQLQFNSGSLAAILHDVPSSAVTSYLNNTKFATYTLPTVVSDYLYVNPHGQLLSSQTIRQALLQAVDLPDLVKNAYFARGSVAKQIYPANINDPRYAAQNITYDPSVLRQAVQTVPQGDRKVAIGYDSSSPDNQQVATLMVSQLAKAGVTTTVQAYPTSQVFGWVADQSGAPDMLVNVGLPDAPAPYFWEHINFDPDGGANLLGCSSAEATSLIALGRQTGSDETFSQAAHAAQSTGCWMNLVDMSDFMVTQPWLKGVQQAHILAYPNSLSLNQLYKEDK